MLLIGFASCKKEEDPAQEPKTKADIKGSVNLYDEGITQIDNSNMIVRAEGTTPIISAITDENGQFTLLDVPFGTHTIVYEKAGYGTYKLIDLEHISSGASTNITDTPSLGEFSSTEVTNIDADEDGNNVTLSVTTDPAGSLGNTRYIRYFLASSPNVSSENYTYFSPSLISQDNPKELTLSHDDLISAGFSSGQTVYVKVYGDSFWSNEYDDPDLDRRIFPNLNMSSADAVSLIVP